eukprot:g998.t1
MAKIGQYAYNSQPRAPLNHKTEQDYFAGLADALLTHGSVVFQGYKPWEHQLKEKSNSVLKAGWGVASKGYENTYIWNSNYYLKPVKGCQPTTADRLADLELRYSLNVATDDRPAVLKCLLPIIYPEDGKQCHVYYVKIPAWRYEKQVSPQVHMEIADNIILYVPQSKFRYVGQQIQKCLHEVGARPGGEHGPRTMKKYSNIIYAGQDPAGVVKGESYGTIRNKAVKRAIDFYLEVVKVNTKNPAAGRGNHLREFLKPEYFVAALEKSLASYGIDPCYPWRFADNHGQLPVALPDALP